MLSTIDPITLFQQNPSALETEHGLVMLLLLYGLLTYRGPRFHKWVPAVVISGILLAVFTPVHGFSLFWPVITGIITPPFLWQASVNITQSGKPRAISSLVVWLIVLGLTAASLMVFSGQPLSTALLLGILTVTLLWYFRESALERSFLSTLGQISLVILMTEIDLIIVSWRTLFGSFFSGAALGIALGFVGLKLYQELSSSSLKRNFFLFWAYIPYLGGVLLGTSAIAATLAAALLVAVYGYNTGLWQTRQEIPEPIKTPLFFFFSTAAWLVLGWQAHTGIPLNRLTGVPAVLVVALAGILLMRQIHPLEPENSRLQLLKKSGAVIMLISGALLLWPDEAALTTILVEAAILVSIALILLLREIIHPLFDLLGIPLDWPAENAENHR